VYTTGKLGGGKCEAEKKEEKKGKGKLGGWWAVAAQWAGGVACAARESA